MRTSLLKGTPSTQTVELAYIECGNGAAAMQVSQVNLIELGPTKLGPVQISSLDLLTLPVGPSSNKFT